MRVLQKFLRRGRPRLVVPPAFNRNSPTVTSIMTPEESGRWLLERMRQQIGFSSYAKTRLLDFGCGVRFSQALVNTDFRIGFYVGIDIDRPMIEFLQKEVRSDSFQYIFVDAYHPMYNPRGTLRSSELELPLSESDFDIVCMFSVITHQNPDDSRRIFYLLRQHVTVDGHLFFTCFLDDSISDYEDRSPDKNGGRCFYNSRFLTDLVESVGWRFSSSAPADGPLIGNSFVFKCK